MDADKFVPQQTRKRYKALLERDFIEIIQLTVYLLQVPHSGYQLQANPGSLL